MGKEEIDQVFCEDCGVVFNWDITQECPSCKKIEKIEKKLETYQTTNNQWSRKNREVLRELFENTIVRLEQIDYGLYQAFIDEWIGEYKYYLAKLGDSGEKLNSQVGGDNRDKKGTEPLKDVPDSTPEYPKCAFTDNFNDCNHRDCPLKKCLSPSNCSFYMTFEDEQPKLASVDMRNTFPEFYNEDGTPKEQPEPKLYNDEWIKKEYEKGLKEGKWLEYPPRQTEKSDDEWVLVKRDGTTEIYGAKYFTLVRTEDLEELFSNKMDFGVFIKFKQKYLEEKE